MKKMFLFLMLLSGAAFGADGRAVLKAFSGPVTIQSASMSRPAVEGQSLSRKDSVIVGHGAVAQVVFANGDALLVKENSIFRVDDTKRGEIAVVDQGEFLVGLPGREEAGKVFSLVTPSTILTSRAGSFWGKLDNKNKTTCACFSGSLDVMAMDKKIELVANQTMEITMGQPVSGPTVSHIDPIYVQTFAVKGSLQGVDAVIGSGKK